MSAPASPREFRVLYTLSIVLRIAGLLAELFASANIFINVLSGMLVLLVVFMIIIGCAAVFSKDAERCKRAEKILRAMLKFFIDIVRAIIGLFKRAQ